MVQHLDLFFPDWQPSGFDHRLHHGAWALRNLLDDQCSFVDVPVAMDAGLVVEQSVLGLRPICTQLRACRDIVKESAPATIFSVGGTCGMETVPVSWLNEVTDGHLTVVWFDAHGDLNTPESSPSRHFHGMPVRTLLGDGVAEICDLMFRRISPDQLVLAGVRDLDQEERDFISDNEITVLDAASLCDDNGLIDAIEAKGCEALYIHIDFDVLDPADFPHVRIPVESGLTVQTLISRAQMLSSRYTVVGSSLVEMQPINDTFGPAVLDIYRASRPGQGAGP